MPNDVGKNTIRFGLFRDSLDVWTILLLFSGLFFFGIYLEFDLCVEEIFDFWANFPAVMVRVDWSSKCKISWPALSFVRVIGLGSK
jgi:hypothetical protein